MDFLAPSRVSAGQFGLAAHRLGGRWQLTVVRETLGTEAEGRNRSGDWGVLTPHSLVWSKQRSGARNRLMTGKTVSQGSCGAKGAELKYGWVLLLPGFLSISLTDAFC